MPHRLPDRDSADVWQRMSSLSEPIFLYGTGNGADKILDKMTRRGITAAGVFASDGFVRNRTFRGFPVRAYSDLCREYGNFAVVLAFGTSRPDVLSNIERIASERTLLCPDVPAFGSVVFDSDYYRAHYDEYLALYARLADDESRRVLSCVLGYKLTGEIGYLLDCGVDDPADGVVDRGAIRVYVDLGAYTGDTVRDAIAKMPNLASVYAFEPEPHAYRRLREFVDIVSNGVGDSDDGDDDRDSPRIRTYNSAAWDTSCALEFTVGSGRGSSAGTLDVRNRAKARTVSVDALALDDVDEIARDHVDYIKFDVEGAESRAIRGAAATILRCRPAMCVSVYHRTEDLLALPSLIESIIPGRRLYLRRERGLPAWGINLYVW